MSLLELKNITKYYSGTIPALSDVSFSASEGEFISVIGSSGSGKSTLLRCINRMIEINSGEIYFDGTNSSKLPKRKLRIVRTKIGMIFQHYNLVERLTVFENVLHGRLGYKSTMAGILGKYTKEEKDKALKIISILGLNEQINKRCDQLSGGQKQRVGIARALIQNPKLILCDEPIASLDPSTSKIIMDYLRNIAKDMGITIIVSLHQVDVAIKYSDRIIGVNKGTILFDGKPDELTSERISEIYNSDSENLMINIG
ncbi:phosphonate ABC transporter ATP-binding protein [Clostridium sp. BL-8]|uniref:phosphonate ABC transporter ATP-binding protein n=1 Tax=Clostridium sp. BL-8 TaxID=349938 RepID=UPI00098CAC18|nr:phosphonate ABC transporter ATP-binding protein [Clostridium sp. BL-8]OOM78626.1 glutamine transport ATP-binding protein GlnQ [Clostridium sp. BL-8]